jgi:hypothetical protein
VAASFYQVLTEAVSDVASHGYDDATRIARWVRLIREAAELRLGPAYLMEERLRVSLNAVYRRMVEQGKLAKYHPGVAKFTLDKVRSHLRAELDRRILASANLIRLNREEAIAKTLRRFEGWSTSIPAGGSNITERRETKSDIRRALAQLPFEERRVLIDQGHKLRASLSEILAKDGQALAARWCSQWRTLGYNYREDHKDRDQKVYLLRGNWALNKGLAKVGSAGYYDDVTAAGEEINCRCYIVWVYNLRDLPKDMLTEKGREELERVQKVIRGDSESWRVSHGHH